MKIGEDIGTNKRPFLEIALMGLIWLIALVWIYVAFLKTKIVFNF